jgi:MFS superfamily sulfate permease-like transporter
VEWVVIDASSINVIDVTALQKIDELREELAARGIVFAHARAKRNLAKFFNQGWLMKRHAPRMEYDFPTVKSAVRAFNRRTKKAAAPEHHTSQA